MDPWGVFDRNPVSEGDAPRQVLTMPHGRLKETAAIDDGGNGEIYTVVGPGVALKGSIRYDGNVRIDGTLEGEIHTEGCLIVGRDAVLYATVNAGIVVCEGSIMGDVTARERVQLLAPAMVTGTITSPILGMVEGARLHGKIRMTLMDRSASRQRKGKP